MKARFLSTLFAGVCCILLIIDTGCKKQDYTISTTTDVNIVDYLRKYPDQFSELVKILDRTNISPFLNAYGTYTCFAPTNAAVKLYLQEIGKTSADELDTAALRSICRLHLIQDTVPTTSFTDGKLSQPTMYGQFLITQVNEIGTTVVNRQAAITQSNILTGNGYIHVIDHVLKPATLTIAKMIEGNAKFSIFSQALKATGLYDTLNIVNNPDTTRRWYTFLAESDSVLKIAGINSYASLVTKYNKTGNPKNPTDSLYLYMAYHIINNIKFVADIVSLPSHITLAPLAVVTTTLDNQRVLLNQATFNDVFEAGVPVDRPNSDNSCTNGVVHSLLGDVFLRIRTPVRVDFDVAAQPEILKLTSVYRKAGKTQTFTLGQLADVTWQNIASTPQYTCEGATSTNFYWKDDHFDWNMRFANAAANAWIEFTTPLLVKGKYKVWMCFRRGQGQYLQVSFDGVPTAKLVDFFSNLNTGLQDAALEATGFKRYASTQPLTTGNNFATLAGVVDVATTDRHKIRITCVKDQGSGANNTTTFDFIQFIPVDDNQLRPLYARDGSIVP